jgi:hypothetical protein
MDISVGVGGGIGVDAPLGVPAHSKRGEPVLVIIFLRHSCVPLASKANPWEP